MCIESSRVWDKLGDIPGKKNTVADKNQRGRELLWRGKRRNSVRISYYKNMSDLGEILKDIKLQNNRIMTLINWIRQYDQKLMPFFQLYK